MATNLLQDLSQLLHIATMAHQASNAPPVAKPPVAPVQPAQPPMPQPGPMQQPPQQPGPMQPPPVPQMPQGPQPMGGPSMLLHLLSGGHVPPVGQPKRPVR